MAGHENGPVLQFATFESLVDEGFWHRLASLKLNHLGIDESPIPIQGILIFLVKEMVSPSLNG